MAVITLIDTTFSAKNISTALSIYEYTVPAGGPYSLRFQVRLYQIAGGGDYTLNLRLNDGDAQTDDPIVPKSTYPAAAGAQSIWMVTLNVDALTGDVINVIALGLAGDTAVTGSIRIFADDAVGPTTYGRTLDVAATGEAGLDFDNVRGTAGIGNIADGVWDEVLSGHVGAGSAGAVLTASGAATDPLLNAVPGTYASGTAGAALGRITSAAITISSPVANNGVITIYGGDDYYAVDGRSIDITDAGGTWPTLTGATVTFYAGGFSKTMTVVTPTGASKCVRLELTKAESLSLLMSGAKSPYNYKVSAALVTSAHVVTLVESTLIVLA